MGATRAVWLDGTLSVDAETAHAASAGEAERATPRQRKTIVSMDIASSSQRRVGNVRGTVAGKRVCKNDHPKEIEEPEERGKR